jgi:hypothetical protein
LYTYCCTAVHLLSVQQPNTPLNPRSNCCQKAHRTTVDSSQQQLGRVSSMSSYSYEYRRIDPWKNLDRRKDPKPDSGWSRLRSEGGLTGFDYEQWLDCCATRRVDFVSLIGTLTLMHPWCGLSSGDCCPRNQRVYFVSLGTLTLCTAFARPPPCCCGFPRILRPSNLAITR